MSHPREASNSSRHLLASESVSNGHPDKVADQIADAIVDAYLAEEPDTRANIDVVITPDSVILAGRIRSHIRLRVDGFVRRTLREVGYDGSVPGFCAASSDVVDKLDVASPAALPDDCSRAADASATVSGYACRETPQFMPLPITMCQQVMRHYAEFHTFEMQPWLSHAECLVTVAYEGGHPLEAENIIVSGAHRPVSERHFSILGRYLHHYLQLAGMSLPTGAGFIVNPDGPRTVGGPEATTGMSGHQLDADTYGGFAPHSGAPLSGKDPRCIDRSGAYLARYVAKNVVASGLADRCEIQLSYIRGVQHPNAVHVDCHGTETVPLPRLRRGLRRVFDFTPGGIIDTLELSAPIYRPTATFGHFGRQPYRADGHQFFGWERTDKAREIRQALA